jgi:3-oxoacid CoA-transferase B subunit
MSFEEMIARRAALEIQDGQVVNLGIGIPNLISRFLPKEKSVMIHSENGVLGMGMPSRRGEENRNLIDAGGAYMTIVPGASFFDSSLSFALVRGGRLHIAFLGALEVSEKGDLANWLIPGKFAPGIGGGMELAQKARRVVVTTTHTTLKGKPKILRECSLPLTARGCVDTIITDLAVMKIRDQKLFLVELMSGATIEEVIGKTDADLIVPESVPVWSPSDSC